MEATDRYDDRDDATGQFEREHPQREYVKAVARTDLATTSDVAEQVGCAHRTALLRLNELEDEGRLTSTMAGRAKVWSRSD